MRQAIEQLHSPNFHRHEGQRKVTCVVLHATATAGLDSPKAWLTNPKSMVSAHYLIDRDGKCLQLVAENDIAWHAGLSEWGGLPGVNAFSIGIELVNDNTGKMDYPDKQLGACAELVHELCRDHDIGLADVVGHKDIAPGRKTDPAGFPWDKFRALVAAYT